MPIFFVEKMWKAFAVQKLFSSLQQKNFSVFGYKVVKHLTSWPLNELFKLTMLWTTGPWLLKVSAVYASWMANSFKSYQHNNHSNLEWDNTVHLSFMKHWSMPWEYTMTISCISQYNSFGWKASKCTKVLWKVKASQMLGTPPLETYFTHWFSLADLFFLFITPGQGQLNPMGHETKFL